MKKISVVAAAIALIIVIAGVIVYFKFLAPNHAAGKQEEIFVEIPTGATFDQVVNILDSLQLIKDKDAFTWLAENIKYKRDPMRSGRYRVESDWSMVQLVRFLKNGPQTPVKVVLNNERLLEDVAAKVARFIEPDSFKIITSFQDTQYLATIGYTPNTLMSLFIPNTYEFYWNTSIESFMTRMVKENKDFWSKKDRLSKAAAMGMRPDEIYTLASIVEKETIKNEEKPRIAGVYLNRLKTGMRLQADPTLVFATRDFEARRITNFHKEFASPYNTYMNGGLPPGPITMASIASIDAVLNAEKHDYYYFCARPDNSGLHTFAKTLEAHNQNAVRYREELNRMGIN